MAPVIGTPHLSWYRETMPEPAQPGTLMTVITTPSELEAFCSRLRDAEFIAVDTEFMRDKTYWPHLCLVQVAGTDEAAAIDPLSPNMDLGPLFQLFQDPKILKVFHAARQDIEIFFHLNGEIPSPLFDTQIAAMVCGFGDSVSYETLVNRLANARIDKSSRFTDWSQRPLSEKQVAYALADVTYLRPVYLKLKKRIERTGRDHWLAEELAGLCNPANYTIVPEDAWRRLKVRGGKLRFRCMLREVAAWREREAQNRNLPRGRILRDEAVLEVAAHGPETIEDLARIRGVGRGFAEGKLGEPLLAAIARGKTLPDDQCPTDETSTETAPGLAPVVELLKVLLKLRCEEHNVAARLVASTSDLEAIAADDLAQVPALSGWRREIFGGDAIALKHGKLAMTIARNRIRLLDTSDKVPDTNPMPDP